MREAREAGRRAQPQLCCSPVRLQIKFFGALNFFFKAPSAVSAAAGESGRVPAPPLPVSPPGAGAAVRGCVSPPPAGRAWCWAPGPPRLSRGAQVRSARPCGGRGAATGWRVARLPRRRCTRRAGRRAGGAGAATGRAGPHDRASGAGGRADAAGRGPGGAGLGPGRWPRPGSRGSAPRARTCDGSTPGLARARRRGGAASRIVREETQRRVGPRSPARRGRRQRDSDLGSRTPDRLGIGLGQGDAEGEEEPGCRLANLPAASPQPGATTAGLEGLPGPEERGGHLGPIRTAKFGV